MAAAAPPPHKWTHITGGGGDDLLVKSENYESDILVSVQGFRQVYDFKLDDRIILTVIDYFGDSHDSFTHLPATPRLSGKGRE